MNPVLEGVCEHILSLIQLQETISQVLVIKGNVVYLCYNTGFFDICLAVAKL